MSERSCENCKHNLALFCDPCPECKGNDCWEAMPPAAITAYPHYVESDPRCYIEKNSAFQICFLFTRKEDWLPVHYCPGCGGRCL